MRHGQKLRRLKCWLRGHSWGPWEVGTGVRMTYQGEYVLNAEKSRTCRRCGKEVSWYA